MGEIFECLFGGMSIGFKAIFGALQIFEQLDGFKEQFISLATGIPVALITLTFIVIKIFKYIRR